MYTQREKETPFVQYLIAFFVVVYWSCSTTKQKKRFPLNKCNKWDSTRLTEAQHLAQEQIDLP